MCYFAAIDAESDFNMLLCRSPGDVTYGKQNTVAVPLLPLHLQTTPCGFRQIRTVGVWTDQCNSNNNVPASVRDLAVFPKCM